MNYLFDRAAYSTLAISLEPFVPTPTPSQTPTVTVTPTTTITPTPTAWMPGQTFTEATQTLGNSFRGLVENPDLFGGGVPAVPDPGCGGSVVCLLAAAQDEARAVSGPAARTAQSPWRGRLVGLFRLKFARSQIVTDQEEGWTAIPFCV